MLGAEVQKTMMYMCRCSGLCAYQLAGPPEGVGAGQSNDALVAEAHPVEHVSEVRLDEQTRSVRCVRS